MKMKMVTVAVVMVLFFIAVGYAANHEGHSGHNAVKSAAHDMSKHAEKIQAHIENMQMQMDKIKTTDDPKEKKKQMQEHIANMRESIKLMRDMCSGIMKSGECPMMKEMHSGDSMKHTMMCHQKSEMMNSILEQIIESQAQLINMIK